jgi:hypothetical protein
MSRVVQLIQRYGDEIEYDLHTRLHLDLGDWFRGLHPWEKLLRLAGQLPRDSRYKAALYDDDDVAAMWATQHGERDDDAPRPELTLEGWTPELGQLVAMTEAIMGMHRTLIAIHNKGKAPEFKPLPRPKTAWDRRERTANLAVAQQLVTLFSPTDAAA